MEKKKFQFIDYIDGWKLVSLKIHCVNFPFPCEIGRGNKIWKLNFCKAIGFDFGFLIIIRRFTELLINHWFFDIYLNFQSNPLPQIETLKIQFQSKLINWSPKSHQSYSIYRTIIKANKNYSKLKLQPTKTNNFTACGRCIDWKCTKI